VALDVGQAHIFELADRGISERVGAAIPIAGRCSMATTRVADTSIT
jgi:hypothetical protein